ncbi:MAG: ankyrin repeat domain-containing protein [Candidatus Dependentiae bacterium]
MKTKFFILILISITPIYTMEKERIDFNANDHLPKKRRNTSYQRQNTHPNLSLQQEAELETNRIKLADAIEYSNLAAIKKIINNNPTIITSSFNSEDNDSLLHIAAQKKCSTETLQLLLKLVDQTENKNEILQSTNSAGRTPLIEAIMHNNLIACRHFVEHNASYLEACTQDDKTCLHLAVLKENELLVAEILKWAEKKSTLTLKKILSSIDYAGRTPLSLAASQDNVDILLKVADENTINLEDKKGCTPLYWATYRQKPINVKKIVERGAKNSPNNDGDYPLHVACTINTSKAYQCLKILRKFSGTTELRNSQKQTALMVAAKNLNKKAFKYLKRKRANLFAQAQHGETILHLLAATPHAQDFIAYYLKKKKVAANNMLETPDAQGRTPLFYALENFDNFKFLVENYGANITAIDFKLNSLLHVACSKKNYSQEVIAYILKHAAALIDWTNNNSETALIISTQLGHTTCMELLLKHGANIKKTDSTGWTPYQWAATNEGPESLQILNNTNQMSSEEAKSALEVAKKSNNQAAIFYLKSFEKSSTSEQKSEQTSASSDEPQTSSSLTY